jgi:hypothetical protein
MIEMLTCSEALPISGPSAGGEFMANPIRYDVRRDETNIGYEEYEWFEVEQSGREISLIRFKRMLEDAPADRSYYTEEVLFDAYGDWWKLSRERGLPQFPIRSIQQSGNEGPITLDVSAEAVEQLEEMIRRNAYISQRYTSIRAV